MKGYQGKTKQMKKYSMFMDRKTQYCQVLPNLIDRFNAIPNKILANYFVEIDKLILKFI